MAKKIGLIIGSIRKESWSRKLGIALQNLTPDSLQLQFIDIANLPLYNQDPDDEGHPPAEWRNFREQLKTMDGFLFITPEYNRSIPGVLKNAIDVGSRPYGQSAWGSKKPGAIISLSMGVIGGFGANHHLRQCMVFLDILCMQQPEVYLSNIQNLLNDAGQITNEDTKKFLKGYLKSFESHVDQFA